MPHQLAVTIRAWIQPGKAGEVQRLLEEMRAGGPVAVRVPFERLSTTHFARLFVLPESTDLDGVPIPASLMYMADIDAPIERHLDQLVRVGGEALDQLLRRCEGWPSGAATGQRVAYLRQHSVRADTTYVNTVGRGVQQIRDEARLREAIEDFLDGKEQQWRGRLPGEVYAAVRKFVADREDLRWALTPPAGPGLAFRAREAIHRVAFPAGLLLASPLLLAAAPTWAVLLRLHELRDQPDDTIPAPEWVRELASLEDHAIQNPFVAIGFVKSGRFRRSTTRGVLRLISYGTRHIYNRGVLAGVDTIHFARWVAIDDRRRVIFASNYDGSLESYMDDFIDKVAWGLNLVFSNGMGYPRTSWLVRGGARDEQRFKAYLRTHQIPVYVWYSAYPGLSARNAENNAAIRAGLAAPGRLSRSEAEAWLARL